MPPTDADHVRDALRRLVCPDCGCQDFQAGPRGGLAMNIRCANPLCAHYFNIGPGGIFGERISCDRTCRLARLG